MHSPAYLLGNPIGLLAVEGALEWMIGATGPDQRAWKKHSEFKREATTAKIFRRWSRLSAPMSSVVRFPALLHVQFGRVQG